MRQWKGLQKRAKKEYLNCKFSHTASRVQEYKIVYCPGDDLGIFPNVIVSASSASRSDLATTVGPIHHGRSNPWPKQRACLAPHSQHVLRSYSDKRQWNM